MSCTRIAGVKKAVHGPLKLKRIYKKILKLVCRIPEESMYRQNVEAIVCHRLKAIEDSEEDEKEIECRINGGRIEMLVAQAEAEYELVQKMLVYKAWEPLVQEPPPDQWKWPPVLQ